ncbi:MAG TPA: AraC family transcriptional regulator [Usitatibacter sp.]|nr:AraC family transcriptional regulator [Usitatibacter sp.]
MDALSEVLRLARFGACVVLDASAHSPWSVSIPATASLARAHVVLEGAARVTLSGEPPRTLESGDLILVPHGDAHLIGSRDESPAVALSTLARAPVAGELVPVRLGGDGLPVRWISLAAAWERHLAEPLVSALPSSLCVPMSGAPSLNALLGALGLTLSASDAPAVGAGLRRDTLATLVVIEALRRHVSAQAPRGKGWLEGVNDRYVGRALALVHGRPGEPWTVEKLGRQVGLSRSALAERFSDVMGEPIFAFLTRWRLQLAADSLLTTPRPIESIAKEAGYESASAFSSAFKRQFRKPPSIWRRRSRRK